MATTPELSPLNDFAVAVQLFDVNTSTGAVVPLTTGTVTGFLSLSDDPEADPVLQDENDVGSAIVATVEHTTTPGTWTVTIDASDLPVTRLDELFAEATPYLILEAANGVRAALKLKYVRVRKMVVA